MHLKAPELAKEM
jgi:hypothetical protein